ncbi:MAG: 2Fe-2S iron-sulfur cluster binding domain-containing protein [Gammaproteobacteria bacterium]|nr:2Fe-2S iron-sulfur cluster binding domain-containing protein [Gammaproteobacteria bacterium]
MSSTIQITIEGLGTIPWQGQSSLLEALEEAGIYVNYSCRAGICAACRAKLVSGDISWRNQPILAMDETDILTCSVVPTSNIVIQLPD